MTDQDILGEFLIESSENLARLDEEMVRLERQPDDPDLLSSIFRAIHTVKGTCGFFGFERLQALAHATEDILGDLREGQRRFDTPLATLLLESVDAIKRMLKSIEAGSGEGPQFEADLVQRLTLARQHSPQPGTAPPAPAPATQAVDAPSPTAQSVTDMTLRVDVGVLDHLMNLVGELVLTRNQALQYNAGRDDTALNTISQRLNLITSELQEGVMKTRMQPIGVLWKKLPRVVRDLANALQKEIRLEMEGAGTELDRTIIEAIKDPLTHIIRNCCDHGIETPAPRRAAGKTAQGRISLRAFHEGGQVNIDVADDGAGIDPHRIRSKAVERGLVAAEQADRLSDREALNLVFLPGFSTAEAVTSISGRGVGMDVVRTHIERIGGTVDLNSRPGAGTTVRVRIPLTLAIIPGLVVEAGGSPFVIPQIGLVELIRLEEEARSRIEYIHSTPVYRLRGRLLPLADLSAVLGVPARRNPEEVNIVVLQADQRHFGLIVDAISDSQEIVVKPLWQQLKGLNCYAGATIMGDGGIALILDVLGLGLRSGVLSPARADTPAQHVEQAARSAGEIPRPLLMFRSGSFERLAIPLGNVVRLERIPCSELELAAGRPVVRHRGRLLPLVSAAEMLSTEPRPDGESLEVIVFEDHGADIGLITDEILDIVEEPLLSLRGADRPGLLGSAVVADRVTDFLDLESAAQWAGAGSIASLERLEAALADRMEG